MKKAKQKEETKQEFSFECSVCTFSYVDNNGKVWCSDKFVHDVCGNGFRADFREEADDDA